MSSAVFKIALANLTRARGLHLLDRGSYINGRAVKMLSGHFSVLKIYICKFSDAQLV